MKIFIENTNLSYKNMFLNMGLTIVPIPSEADIICFTGGADVAPMLYEEGEHPTTSIKLTRDRICANLFYKNLDKKFVGICRGSQFLNVMNGGSLFQNVNGHNLNGTHKARDVGDGKEYNVTSTHHQMMIPTDEAEVILVAYESTVRETFYTSDNGPHKDIECVYYEESNSLCFQPHPEYGDDTETLEIFTLLMKQYLE